MPWTASRTAERRPYPSTFFVLGCLANLVLFSVYLRKPAYANSFRSEVRGVLACSACKIGYLTSILLSANFRMLAAADEFKCSPMNALSGFVASLICIWACGCGLCAERQCHQRTYTGSSCTLKRRSMSLQRARSSGNPESQSNDHISSSSALSRAVGRGGLFLGEAPLSCCPPAPVSSSLCDLANLHVKWAQ